MDGEAGTYLSNLYQARMSTASSRLPRLIVLPCLPMPNQSGTMLIEHGYGDKFCRMDAYS